MVGILDAFTEEGGNPLLTGLAIGLLEASGPNLQPTSTGQGIARGLQLGTQLQVQRSQQRAAEEQLRLAQAEAQRKATLPLSTLGKRQADLRAGRITQDQIDTADATTLARNAEAAGLTPGTPEFEAFIRAGVLKPSSTVNINTLTQTEEAKTVGKFFGDEFTGLQKRASKARDSNTRIARTRQLLKGVTSGRTVPTKNTLKSIARGLGVDLKKFGIDPDTVPFAEGLASLQTQFALEFVQQTKGAISDREIALFLDAAPGLARTNEGNELILELQEEINNRAIEVAKNAREYRKQNGRLDEGFFDQLDAFNEANPLFTEDLAARIQALSGQQAPKRLRFNPQTGDLEPIR